MRYVYDMFTICSFNSPDLDGYQGTRENKNPIRGYEKSHALKWMMMTQRRKRQKTCERKISAQQVQGTAWCTMRWLVLLLALLGSLAGTDGFTVLPALRVRGPWALQRSVAAVMRQGRARQPPLCTAASNNVQDDEETLKFDVGEGTEAQSASRWEQWYGKAKADLGDTQAQQEAREAAELLEGADDEAPLDNLGRLVSGTYGSLDWMVLKRGLAKCGRTTMGKAALAALEPYEELRDVERAHNAIDEVRLLREQGVVLPISLVKDIVSNVVKASKGEVLGLEELFEASKTLSALQEIEKLLKGHDEDAPTLVDIGSVVHVDPAVVQTLARSFDMTGALSTKAYPQLQELRKEIDRIGASITTTMDQIVRSTQFNSLLQDKFYTIRDNRFVLPVAVVNKNKVDGIVHGMSGTGATVYIEPQQVIDLNNRLRMAEGELKAEENRIMLALSNKLGSQSRETKVSIKAVTEMDLAYAREDFAMKLKAIRPKVGDAGGVSIKEARHPVLVLRGVKPVANDIDLNEEQPGLVISGPNAGGKTVALKTVGLCALLVQHGCWIPAKEGSRMDLFRGIFAAIGDQQTVQEDLSSFSSHLLTLNTMMQHIDDKSLVLLDEIASGTDPAQGAALAQAVLERMLESGPRMVVTTHYQQLKTLATVDNRFAVAAMQYVNGAPTYKVLHGVTGESHAFSIAKKMGILEEVLDRASYLMGEQAAVTETLEALEELRGAAQVAADEAEQMRSELARRVEQLEEREQLLKTRSKELEKQGAQDFLNRLSEAESTIGQVVKDLQRNPNFKEADSARSILSGVREEMYKDAFEAQGPAVVDDKIDVGDTVKLMDIGSVGEVLSSPNAKGDIQVRVGGLSLKTNIDRVKKEASQPNTDDKGGSPGYGAGGAFGKKRGTNTIGKKKGGGGKKLLSQAVRTPGNTLDLRGVRAEDVGQKIDMYLDGLVRGGAPYAFILSGHGTGVVKKVVREHLKSCRYATAHGPADFEQGGDALMVVALE